MTTEGGRAVDSMIMTVGAALQSALDLGTLVDVDTTTGRLFSDVSVGAVERFSIVLLDATKAHVVSREHIVSVSVARDVVLHLDQDERLPADAGARAR